MICKQEVCAWFKGLSGSKRIDLMCGLLQICLAPELRFIGSCLEDLCRKDYDALRTLEVEANNIQHIQTLTSDLLDNMMRAKWNLILPLLESTNTVCANAMYSVLCDCIDKILLDVMQLQKENSSSRNCREIMDDILLLLTMASNHPAFSFTHKLKFDNCLTDLQALQEEESCDDRKSSQPHTTSVQQSQTKKPEAVHHPSSEQRPPPPPPPPSHSHNAEVNGHSHPHRSTPSQGNNSHHGNGIGGVANRDNGVGGRDGSQSNGGGGDAGNDVVHSRIQSPRHALSKPINIIKGGTDLGEEDSGNIVNSRGAITTQIIYNSHLPSDHRSPQTPTPQTPPHSEVLCSPGRPPILSSTNLLTTRPSSSTPQTFHGVLVSGAGSPLPSSPLSSPHVSPSSSVHSASSSCSSSSCSSSTTTPNPNSVAVWLKRIRLHKYTEMLQGFSFSDLLQLTDKDLENLKLTKGAQKKIRKEIDKLNMLGEHAEKWVNGGTSPLTIWTPPPSEHSPSPYNSPSSQQAPLQLKPAPAPVVISSAATSSTVTSPSSEFTSPPESPLVVMPANSQQQNKDLPPMSSIGSNGGSSQPLPSVPTANAPPPPPPMTFPPPHMAPKSPCGSTTSSGSINDSLNGDAPPPPPPMPSLPPGPRPMLPMPLDYQLVPPPHLYNYNLYHLAAMANGPRPLLRSPINPTHSFPPPPPPPAPTSTQPSPAPSPGSGLRSRPTSLHGLPPSPPTMFLPPGDRNSPGPGPVSTSSTVPTSTNVTFCTSFSTSFQGPVAATTSFCYPPTASPTPPLPRTASTPTPPPPPTPTQQQPLPPIMCCNQCGTSTPIYWPFPPHSANGLLPMPPAPPPLMRPPHNGFIQPGAAHSHTLSQQQQPQHSTTTPPTPGQYIMPPPPPPQYMALHPGGGHTGHGGHGSHHPGGAGGAGGSKHKAGAHITCYRCGGPGHRAIECKKHIPPSPGSMESKTGFHLKYAAPPPPPPVAGGE